MGGGQQGPGRAGSASLRSGRPGRVGGQQGPGRAGSASLRSGRPEGRPLPCSSPRHDRDPAGLGCAAEGMPWDCVRLQGRDVPGDAGGVFGALAAPHSSSLRSSPGWPPGRLGVVGKGAACWASPAGRAVSSDRPADTGRDPTDAPHPSAGLPRTTSGPSSHRAIQYAPQESLCPLCLQTHRSPETTSPDRSLLSARTSTLPASHAPAPPAHLPSRPVTCSRAQPSPMFRVGPAPYRAREWARPHPPQRAPSSHLRAPLETPGSRIHALPSHLWPDSLEVVREIPFHAALGRPS